MAIIKPNNNTISAITALPAAITTGKVLQVVSVTKIGAFTATNLGAGSVTDITGVAANITPSSTSNKILISYSVQGVSEASSRVVNLCVYFLLLDLPNCLSKSFDTSSNFVKHRLGFSIKCLSPETLTMI